MKIHYSLRVLLRALLIVAATVATAIILNDHGKARFLNRMMEAMDDTHTGLFEVDEHSNIIYVSEAACRMLGWTQEELTGKSLHIVIPVQYQEAHDKMKMNNPKPRVSIIVSEAKHKDGSLIPMRTRTYISDHRTCFAVMNRADEIVVKEVRRPQSLPH